MKRVRMGVVGCGIMGQAHVERVQNLANARLTAVSDIVEATARRVGEAHGVAWFSDYRALISSGLCDAVLIATPHLEHVRVGLCAFKAGLHVLCEKPLTVTVGEADRFLAAARQSGRVFAVMFQRRLEPEIRLARSLVESGALGTIRRTLMVDPWYRSQTYYDSAAWRGTWSGEGGGVLLNQSPHQIDVFTLLAGLPLRVTARTRAALHKIEVEDEACALLEYENGAWGYFYATTCEMPCVPRMEIVGDQGKLVWQRGSIEFHEVRPGVRHHLALRAPMWEEPKTRIRKLRLPRGRVGHAEVIRNFCNAILRGDPLIAPAEEALRSIEFINALILSGQTGRPVELPVSRRAYAAMMARLQRGATKKRAR